MINRKQKNKLQILWDMRKWSLSYINWRFYTAYPKGWKYAIIHPITFSYDLWKYLSWCQKIDKDLN